MPRFRFVPLMVLAACAAPAPEEPGPPPGTPVVTIASGTSEWGGMMEQIYAGDIVVLTTWEGVGQPQTRTVGRAPEGAHARMRAVLAREGPRALARQGGAELCPGSAETISAQPPAGRFEVMVADCRQRDPAYEGLRRALAEARRGG